MPNWTEEQKDAIYQNGHNIIVSAGAGSGKTAVLTERIITKLKDGIPLDRLLVLTFTNAAAREMKERVRRKILASDTLKNRGGEVDSAYITTFDAYALSLVKRYHDLLDMREDIGIIDATFMALKKKEWLEEIMEECYQKEEVNFSKLIRDFVLKSDQELVKAILTIDDKLSLIYDRDYYLDHYIDTYFDPKKIEKDCADYVMLLLKYISEISTSMEKLSSYVDENYYAKLEAVLSPLFDANTYDEIKKNIPERLPTISKGASDEAKAKKKELSILLTSLRELTRYTSIEEMKDDYMQTKPYVEAIIDILKRLAKKANSYKKEHDRYEFYDIAFLAIRLVKEFPEVKRELKDQFIEILVDEYQDTSDLQELFIQEIAHDNVYMVGDIKQSIYRFRNANPTIFKEKYEEFSKHKHGEKIDLNKNFRSRNTVLSDINTIFNNIMDLEVGGADYRKSHQLVFGNENYLSQGKLDHRHMEIYTYPYSQTSIYTKEELEAFYIAYDIKEKIENHYLIFDAKTNEVRPVAYQDFAILMDLKKYFPLYKKIFTYLQIPLEMNQESILNDSVLMMAIKNILYLIGHKKVDAPFLHAYASVMRSIVLEYPDSEVFRRITNRDFQDDPFYQKILMIRSHVGHLSNRQLVEEIIEEFHLYDAILKLGDIDENLYRLDYLLSCADELTTLGYHAYQFIDYMSSVFDKEFMIKYNSNVGSGNAVKMMSIHKSKGLEFPICYYPAFYQNFVLKDLKDTFLFDIKYGILTPTVGDEMKRTFYYALIKEEYYKESVSEKLRLLYVALTRAKEKIIIFCNFDEHSSGEEMVSTKTRLQFRNFQDVLESIYEKIEPFVMEYNRDVSLSKDYQGGSIQEEITVLEDEKLTVREQTLPREVVESKIYSHHQNNLKSYEEVLLMEVGNYLHEVLETISLSEPNLSTIPLSNEVKERILTFLNQPLLSRISEAKIYQEYEFVAEEKQVEKHGVIDLMLEYDDHIDIIDYKLRNIDKSDYEAQLAGYQEYITHKTKKPVSIYLYSILDGKMKALDRRSYVTE